MGMNLTKVLEWVDKNCKPEAVERLRSRQVAQVLAVEVRRLQKIEAAAQQGILAAKDMLSGWRYIRQVHGNLYGVGWDRAQKSVENAIVLLKQALEKTE